MYEHIDILCKYIFFLNKTKESLEFFWRKGVYLRQKPQKEYKDEVRSAQQ